MQTVVVIVGVAVVVLALAVGTAVAAARRVDRVRPGAPLGADHPLPPLPEQTLTVVTRLVAAGKPVAAIKHLRTGTGLGPADARRIVRSIAAGRPARPAADPGSPPTAAALPDDVRRAARSLIAQHKHARAIRLIRDRTGLDLVSAKAAADRLRDASADDLS